MKGDGHKRTHKTLQGSINMPLSGHTTKSSISPYSKQHVAVRQQHAYRTRTPALVAGSARLRLMAALSVRLLMLPRGAMVAMVRRAEEMRGGAGHLGNGHNSRLDLVRSLWMWSDWHMSKNYRAHARTHLRGRALQYNRRTAKALCIENKRQCAATC